MTTKDISRQAKVFLYDLKNARHEYSFSKTESWVISQTTTTQKQALENQFYPVLYTQCTSADLAELTELVIAGQNAEDEKFQNTPVATSKEHIYLVAHCATKVIR